MNRAVPPTHGQRAEAVGGGGRTHRPQHGGRALQRVDKLSSESCTGWSCVDQVAS